MINPGTPRFSLSLSERHVHSPVAPVAVQRSPPQLRGDRRLLVVSVTCCQQGCSLCVCLSAAPPPPAVALGRSPSPLTAGTSGLGPQGQSACLVVARGFQSCCLWVEACEGQDVHKPSSVSSQTTPHHAGHPAALAVDGSESLVE